MKNGRRVVTFLNRVEGYLRATGISPTRFGREAVGDPRFVRDLRLGREPRPSMVERVNVFMGRGQDAH